MHFKTQCAVCLQLDVLFGNLPEMVEFQVEFLKTLEDGTRLVPDLDKLEKVDQFKVLLKNNKERNPWTEYLSSK